VERSPCGHVDLGEWGAGQSGKCLGARQPESVLGLGDHAITRQRLADAKDGTPHDRPGERQLARLLIPDRDEVLRIGEDAPERPQPPW
jgi:hypothetical protein